MLKKILLALLGLFIIYNVIRHAVNHFIDYANTGKTFELVSGIGMLIVLVPIFYNPVLFKKKQPESEKQSPPQEPPKEVRP
jgi:hypothetical protein